MTTHATFVREEIEELKLMISSNPLENIAARPATATATHSTECKHKQTYGTPRTEPTGRWTHMALLPTQQWDEYLTCK